jgi:D-glycero-alpha-D-manno-heptose 1-phosphate guanylyltransferase
MQAIILAGGLGTRLKSVVADKPKVLSPVAGNPFLKYIIDYLLQQKITNFIFLWVTYTNKYLSFYKQHILL